MEDLRSLQTKCREIGISCTGNKNQQIDRLQEHDAQNVNKTTQTKSTELSQRVMQLEELVAYMRLQVNLYRTSDFDPSMASSSQQTFVTPEETSPNPESNLVPDVATTPVFVSQIPQISSTTMNISVPQFYPRASINTEPRSVYSHQYSRGGGNPPAIETTNVPVHPSAVPYVHNVAQPTNFQQFLPPTTIQNTPPNSFAQRVPINMFTYQTPPSMVHAQQPYIPSSGAYTMPQILPSQQTYFQHNVNIANPYGNVKEIISLLPDFNPVSNESLNSVQFVKKSRSF